MKSKILADFQICTSVPLSNYNSNPIEIDLKNIIKKVELENAIARDADM